MKDNKNDGIYFQSPGRWIKTESDGRLELRHKVLADYDFTSYPEAGEYRFEDLLGKLSGLEVVRGVPGGAVSPHPVPLVAADTVQQSGRPPQPHVGVLNIRQLPSGLTVQGAKDYQLYNFGRDETFLRQTSSRTLLPTNANDEKTFHLRIVSTDVSAVRKSKAVLSFAEPGVSQAFFTIAFSSNSAISAIFHDTSGAGYKQQVLSFSSGSIGNPGIFDIFVTTKLDSSGYSSFNNGYIYRPEKGKEVVYVAAPVAGTHTPPLGTDGQIYGNPAMFMGFGELTGGVDQTFTADDYLTGSLGARATVYNGKLTEKEMRAISFRQGSSKTVFYRSGIEGEATKKLLKKRDRATSYPQSRQPIGRRLQNKATDPYNDTHAVDSVLQPLVYPEMIPLSMFSGSVESAFSRGGDGGGTPLRGRGRDYLPSTGSLPNSIHSSSADTRGFQISSRHQTPLDKRMIANGIPRESVMHTDTLRFQRFTTNEIFFNGTSTFGDFLRSDDDIRKKQQRPNILNRNPLYDRSPSLYASLAYNSGSIAPFDESRVSTDAAHINKPAVSDKVYPGLQQKLGDHLVLEIPLNPEESTTFGVDRRNNFSMGYFNFANSKWDTVGQIPGLSGSTSQFFGGFTASDSSRHANYNGLIASTSLAFAGTSGFAVYPENGNKLAVDLKHRGAPTDLFGFPVDDKYKASDNQLLDMSDYIDAPFILERWEIQFEADVEESGPESLGYVMPVRTEVGDFSRVYTEDGALINPKQHVDRWANLGFQILIQQ